ncbi:TRAP transporter substrate-binding protein [Roseibacillus persicicus]|uniref:TRAP transporter substrate-binding protein n=1 Tax=Roseibacillus persicicus TaxID=454148 RepID=UPI00398B8DB4
MPQYLLACRSTSRFRRRSWVLLLFITALQLVGCKDGSRSLATTLRIAHPLNASHPNNQALEFFAKELAKQSGGKMEALLYPGGQLGSDRECLELLQIGSLDMTVTSAAVLEGFIPEFKIFGLPYLFNDREQRLDALSGQFGQGLLEEGLPYRLRGMAYFDSGSRSFYTKDAPVRTPEDLAGLKVRVLGSPMAIRTVRALGASPTPISWGELYTALQQGVVDAAENNPPSLVTARHYEIAPYFSLDEHSAIPDVVTYSAASWNRLSEQERAWVSESLKAAVAYQHELWAKAEKDALIELQKQGVTIHRPDKAAFIEAVQPLYQDFQATEPKLYRRIEPLRQP